MKISDFCFRSAGTCLVLVCALGILLWIFKILEILPFLIGIGVIGFIAVIIGIIASIWE